MTLPSNRDLAATLAALVKVMDDACDDWWLIGSAAVALHGGDAGVIADVDVITSWRDLDALYNVLPLTNSPEEGKPMFRSERFGRWSAPPLDVEFMAGLKLRVDDEWRAVQPRTRRAVFSGEHTLYAPSRNELIAILHLFGREKDLRRAASLEE